MRIYDYKCPNGHIEEHVVADSSVTEHVCHACGESAARQLSSPPFVLDGASGHFPGRAMKWEREHEKAGRGSHFQDNE